MYSLPSASETVARGVPRRDDEHAVPVEAREPAQVDLVALVLAADRARQLEREQVVDRDAVLLARREDDDQPRTTNATASSAPTATRARAMAASLESSIRR